MVLGMRFLLRRFSLGAAALGVFLLFSPAAEAKAPDYDLSRMRQLNPDFSTYPESKGIVWLKQVSYGAGRDGGMERTHLWVLLGRRGLEPRWLNWDIPEPVEGSTEILEAGVYAFESGHKLADVVPAERVQGGVTMRAVRFEELPETFILVLSWRDSFPASLSLEDWVWTQETLPVWECVLDVAVPDGRPFFHRSLHEVRPEVRKGVGESLYTWRSVNTEPLTPGQLLASPRGGIAFSMRRGPEGIAKLMRDRAAASVPQAPSAALEGFRKGPEAGTAALLAWLYGQPEAVLPESCFRILPSEGPWTREEKVLLAHAWLRAQGVDAPLYWKTAIEPEADSPVCTGSLLTPVLEIPAFRGARARENFFCNMDDAPRMGRTSPLLMGDRLFAAAGEGGLSSRKVPEARAAENRLRALFDLRLSPEGALSGTVRLQARGVWRPLLFRRWEDTRAAELIPSLFQNLKGYDGVAFKESSVESELSFRIAEIPGILGTGGQNLLVNLPAFLPRRLQALAEEAASLELAFPFLMEQRVSLLLPSDIRKVMLPADTERTSQKILYSDSYKAVKLKKVTAEARLQISAARLGEDDRSSLKTALELWRGFSARPLPLQKRSGD